MRKGGRLLLPVLAAFVVLAVSGPAPAATQARLSGGGTADISQVAMTVAISDSGSASGSFLCLMAGRSAFVLEEPEFGLAHVMAVHATPTSGSISGEVVSFSGPGRLILDGAQKVDVNVEVWVDVETQTFQLTVLGVATLPVETLLTGKLALR